MSEGVAPTNRKLLNEGVRIVERAHAEGLTARLLGGVGIVLHCPAHTESGGHRAIGDIDLIVKSGDGRRFAGLLEAEGYRPETRFNALHGHHRMLWHGDLGRLDVLIGAFEMCHQIDMAHRLELDWPTLTATDLLLTKLQIVELNAKDALDAEVLLSEHDIERKEGDCINLLYLETLVANDWGLWRTVTGTLAHLEQLPSKEPVSAKARELRMALFTSPKTLKFRMRARIGEKVPWYVIPDEVG
jgi:hypothetical protein